MEQLLPRAAVDDGASEAAQGGGEELAVGIGELWAS
jgi:hypothetical protein